MVPTPKRPTLPYEDYLKSKVRLAQSWGFTIDESQINPALKPHNKAMVKWMVEGGRRACFASFGLHKTVTQLEVLRLILEHEGGRGLIVCPLGVRQEFKRDALQLLGWQEPPTFIRRIEECDDTGIYLTNYETVRDGKLDPRLFSVASLDEAAILRGFGGSKTFREFMRLFTGDAGPSLTDGKRRDGLSVPYRFVATATPSPNEYIELLAYADFLGIMDTAGAKTRFFKRDSTKADKLTLHKHKEREFWLWVASWALFVQKPSDLGFSDEGYDLPPLDVRWHEVPSDHSQAGTERWGQVRMFCDTALGVTDASREKNRSLPARLNKMLELREEDPGAHRILWHDRENEREAIEKSVPGVVSVYGKQDLDLREQSIIDFSDGKIQELAGKPCMLGSGCNFQRFCNWAIFMGIGFKFNEFIQGIHRLQRFGQDKPVRVDLIYTEAEREVKKQLERKWLQHEEMTQKMADIIREFGLSQAAMMQTLTRKMGVERIEIKGERYRWIQNDNVPEMQSWEDNSVHLMFSSWPFSTQYEYSANYADFGHSDNNNEFFAQMDYLTPECYRALSPGRLYVIHVKDRIVPGGMTGLGFQTVYPFHMEVTRHMMAHGFGFMGMKTIVTDVVRENNQTYRLGWTEQCKDGTKMGCGMSEYLLLFRKPPGDTTDSYADVPVVKQKPLCVDSDGNTVPFDRSLTMIPGSGFSRARWQFDAHGFNRSSGNRLLSPEEVVGLPASTVFKLFRQHSLNNVYDFEHDVKIGEALELRGNLPPGFMLLQPQSWHEAVWTDITRMLTLNGAQHAKGKEMHLCLARGSLVLTYDGYMPIEALKVGDMVLTHEGRWKPVTAVACMGNKAVVKAKAQGVPNLRLTPDHKLWVRKGDPHHPRQTMQRGEPGWVEALETKSHYINLKLPPVQKSCLTEQEWWIVGRWLADGHQGTRGDFTISVGRHKLDTFLKVAGEYAGTGVDQSGPSVQVRLKGLSEALKTMLRLCGRGASGKVVPGRAMCLEPHLAEALLSGYLSGDGHLDELGRWLATSVSRSLLLGMAVVAQRARGVIAAVYAGRPAGEYSIEGRTGKSQQEWIMCLSKRNRSGIMLEDGAWKKVRSVDDDGEAEVWDISVADDASFTAEGCVVKNCPMQFDTADRVIELFSMPGEIVADPFGGIATVPYRAILKGRIGWGVELNPAYFLDGASYLRAAEMKVSMPTLFDLTEVESEAESKELMEVA